MADLKSSQLPFHLIPSRPLASPPTPVPPRLKKPKPISAYLLITPKSFRVLRPIGRSSASPRVLRCSQQDRDNSANEDSDRPPFNLNLAVLLAGFAFEAYSSPPENAGQREIDAAQCQTVFLSEQFLHEIYDGQLFIKLRKGLDFPALDPWGTSDPYVVVQLEGQVAKSSIKWATKEPIWNEDLTFNFKTAPSKSLQVMAWDANLVTPHKRMGNAEIKLESLCDGNLHEVVLQLEGIGGGGKIYMEVKYKSYDEIAKDKQWWRMPFVSNFLMNSPLGSSFKQALGSQSVNTSQFVQSAFEYLKAFDYTYSQKLPSSNDNTDNIEGSREFSSTMSDLDQSVQHEMSPQIIIQPPVPEKETGVLEFHDTVDGTSSLLESEVADSEQRDTLFWKNFSDILNQSVLKKLGFSLPEIKMWGRFDLLNQMSMQSQRIAEEEFIESGLATPERKDSGDMKGDLLHTENKTFPSLAEIRNVSWSVLSQTETVLGALIVLTSNSSEQNSDSPSLDKDEKKKEDFITDVATIPKERLTIDTQEAEEMRKLFSSAESAMEAWAMLATSLGRTSFIKSEFEKICFVDNANTDTQVAIWRDSVRRRLIVAFRGTEQIKWKDLQTDLMLLPVGLNPERLGGDFEQEIQVHSGFLNAYDSVRSRIMALIKLAIGFRVEDDTDNRHRWHVYVTGHSLGGALATLLALELTSSQMAKCGVIYVTMYNFGSPRVGNRRFAEVYNAKVKDSWRVVNHRDIIPTVPRLMGYCHIAQPVYLAAGDLRNALANIEISDGYQGDLIGESTPAVLVGKVMRGEKQLVEKILQTEINLLRSLRDGTALMQHMEDFYYITLLESVRSSYRSIDTSNSIEEGNIDTLYSSEEGNSSTV